MKVIFVRTAWILFISALLLLIPRVGGLVADQFDYSAVDPDGAFAWISVHHIVQAAIFLVIMILISRFSSIKFGFGPGNKTVGWFYVRLFLKIFSAYAVISILIVTIIGSFQIFPYPLTAGNIAGQLGFQLLLSGPSEELIFRAFAITMFSIPLKRRFFRGKLSSACLLAAVIFGLAHIGISLNPIAFSYDPGQVVYAAALGIFYGICYEESESMIYPMIMHSISNVAAVGISIIAGFMLA